MKKLTNLIAEDMIKNAWVRHTAITDYLTIQIANRTTTSCVWWQLFTWTMSASLGHPHPQEILRELVEQGFVRVRCTCHPTISVKAWKEMQMTSSNPNQWPSVIFSSFTSELLTKATLLPLQWHSNVTSNKLVSGLLLLPAGLWHF